MSLRIINKFQSQQICVFIVPLLNSANIFSHFHFPNVSQWFMTRSFQLNVQYDCSILVFLDSSIVSAANDGSLKFLKTNDFDSRTLKLAVGSIRQKANIWQELKINRPRARVEDEGTFLHLMMTFIELFCGKFINFKWNKTILFR